MNTKHWNLIQGLALTALLPLFAACSSEGDELLQSEEKQPVQVNITRATMNDGNDWSWQDKDEIKMNITPYGGTATEYILTYQNGNWSNTALDEMVLLCLPQCRHGIQVAPVMKVSVSHMIGILMWLNLPVGTDILKCK